MEKELQQLLDTTRVYIFDFDGTIADTERLQWEAHKEVCKKLYNIDLDQEHINSYLGMADELVCQQIEKDFGIDMKGKYDKYIKLRIKTAFKLVQKYAVPFLFMKEVLSGVMGKRFYLVTAQNPKLVYKMLRAWNLYGDFNERNTFICDKNHNKMYYYDYIFKLVKNAKPEEIALFEDVNKYLTEGKNRGYRTIGIDSGFGGSTLEADYVIKVKPLIIVK